MKPVLSDTSKQKCYDLISGDFSLKEFEQWVYRSKTLEKELSEEDHLQLISFQFQTEWGPNTN